MSTQRPLVDMIPSILLHIQKWDEYTKFNQKLYWILEGQLEEEVKCALQREIISPSALRRIQERIPPINVLKKTSDKLSEVYVDPPSRLLNKEADLKLLESISATAKVDQVFQETCRMLIAQHMVALEPYVHKRKQKLRLLGAHQFLPYSDDPVNPTDMTVFIKFLGREQERFTTQYDQDGRLVDKDDIEDRMIYALYSDSEWVIIDSSGVARTDLMGGMPVQHDFGRIPQVLVRKNDQELIPFPNKEGFSISVLVPKMLADLNFAAQFSTHSIIWSRNADLGGQSINPDAIVDLGTADKEDGQPEIGVIKPEVDIDKQLLLINYQLVGYFDMVGIKISSSDILTNGRDSSAIGKAVDQADTTSVRKKHTEKMRAVEVDVWDAMASAQDVWSRSDMVDERRLLSKESLESLSIHYAEIRPVKTRKQLLEELTEMNDLKVITKEQTLRELRPEMTDKQIKEWMSELDKELDKMMDELMKASTAEGGQFGEGNEAGAAQDETSKTEATIEQS